MVFGVRKSWVQILSDHTTYWPRDLGRVASLLYFQLFKIGIIVLTYRMIVKIKQVS